MENEGSPPRPLDNGRVAQAVVEYTGSRLGTVIFRGPSGRPYGFDASPWNKRQYVLSEDLERFRGRPDFLVLEETRIDPEAEKLRALITDVLEQRAGTLPADEAPISDRGEAPERPRLSQRRSGRPPGKGLGAWLDCLMTCARLGEHYGSSKEAYDAIQDYLEQHTSADQYVPPRARLASMRSYARRKGERAGRCVWYRHPEPVPRELIPA